VRDLDFPVEIVEVPTVREPDGLALPSRNTYLDAAARQSALALSRALLSGESAAAAGAGAVRRAARDLVDAEPGVVLDYLVLVDPSTLQDVPDDHLGRALLAVAAKVGTTRLIDNVTVYLGDQGSE
jgi:pantoate--beta-alanine ligase